MDLDEGGIGPARSLWFTLPDEKAGPEAVRTFRDIEDSLADRRQAILRNARLWSNSWLGSLYDLASARRDLKAGPWNVCAAAVSTAMSLVVRSPVKITLETSNAEHSVQRLARDATRWFYGVLSDNKVAEKVAPLVFQDAAVCDVGVAVVRVIDKKIVIERVFPDEVIISEIEALYGTPHQAAVKKYFPKHSILTKYGTTPEKRKAIEMVSPEAPGNSSAAGYRANLIPVFEAWSIQGKHVIAVNGCTLEIEDWDYDFLPLVPLVIEPAGAGWYGRGYCTMLAGYQCELFQINDLIDTHVRLMTSAKWVLESNSGIDPSDLDSQVAGILTKNKGADNPHLLVGQVPRDLLEEREKIYNRALEEVGLSSWGISGQEPASRSGIAMTVSRDKERGRLLTPGQAFEAWHVVLAEVCFAMGQKTQGTAYVGKGPSDKSLDSVDFKKIAGFIKNAPFKVRPYPISALPDSPEEKRKVIESWMTMGIIQAPTAISLLDLPDVNEEASLMSASRELILHQIEQILTLGREGYSSPEANMDLVAAQKMFLTAWNRGRMQGVSEKHLDLLDRWIFEAAALAKPPAPAPVEIRPGVGVAPAAVEPVNPDQAGGPAGLPIPVAAPGMPPGPPGLPPEAMPMGEAPPGLPTA